MYASGLREVSAAQAKTDPWTATQLMQPEELAKTLADSKSRKPLVVCVGFGVLYRSAHIPGAIYQGPAANPEGLASLKKWAEKQPRDQSIVIYCGCCPWKNCPNIRPAFQTLKNLGFTQIKVLSIETDLATNWIGQGYPVEKPK